LVIEDGHGNVGISRSGKRAKSQAAARVDGRVQERPPNVFQVAEVYDVLHEKQARLMGFQLAFAQAGVELMQRPVLLPGEDEALVEMALFQEFEAELTCLEILFF
jgi:hypothetical protein